jgi:CRP-like cAMP-binding protein/Fe-S-cluster-containing dehydrogenase component
MVQLTIDGRPVAVPKFSVSPDPTGKPLRRATTIYDAALKAGVQIPILCHREYMTPVAVCRVCSVQVNKEWRLSPACYRPVEPGMVVSTHQSSDRVRSSVRTLTELLMADHPTPCAKHHKHHDCELELLAERLQIPGARFHRAAPESRPKDPSSLVIAVDHNACILCDRCVRGCNEIRHNEVIGRRGKGYKAGIAFDLNTPMGDSSCVACGECMVSCPTGALVNNTVVTADPWEDVKPRPAAVPAEDLIKHQLFEGISLPFLHFNQGAVVRRRYKKGDVICEEGKFGSTAFLIESGKVRVFLRSPIRHVKSQNKRAGSRGRGLFGLVRRSRLVARGEDTREDENTETRYIHVDAPVPLKYDNPVAVMEAGDLFGEMTCMNFYPRSATVRADEDCTVLEMLRNVLYILQRNKRSRDWLEERYRARAIDNHLRSVPIFADYITNPEEFSRFVDYLRPRVELVRMNPGDVVFRQDDPADDFYLVRTGFIKVTQGRPGGEHVLNYVGPGHYFGEIGLMSHFPEVQKYAPRGVRTATCSALDHVDLVRIRGEDFHVILDRFPGVRDHFVTMAIERLAENEESRRRIEAVPLGDFLDQGLMNAQSLLVLDLEKCTRCDECTKACADSHDGVTRLIREGLRFDKFLVASSCRSCLDPYCMVGCPVGSIRRRNSREIIIEDWCIGCGKCAENCPYGNINMHPFLTDVDDPQSPGRKVKAEVLKATMCDLCTGLDGQPSCVYACPHDAAHRMTGKTLLEIVRP